MNKLAYHTPVMASEVTAFLTPQDRVIVDATCGNGGHTALLARKAQEAVLIVCMDRDEESIKIAQSRINDRRVKFVHARYAEIQRILLGYGEKKANFFLYDLGLSSFQIESSNAGFTFKSDEPLDMRFDRSKGFPLSYYLTKLSRDELADILHFYGEVRNARGIAKAIAGRGKRAGITTTFELIDTVKKQGIFLSSANIQKMFMAFRIFVNNELAELVYGIENGIRMLAIGGRMVFITYHSLEDRIVKNVKKVEGMEPFFKRPVYPRKDEITRNRKSRSAKLRVFIKRGEIDDKRLDLWGVDRLSTFPARLYK